jgi:hypothetical protein|tara:strand:+ start:325 stop:969 length:645 start_codon:yes stop_codon:yes gene_type:complete
MPHQLDASGNPIIRHGRPSPRTGSTGAGIQKFGTQQLKYLDTGGVIEKDVGARTRLTFGGEATTPATPFSARYQQQRPATIRTQAQLETSPHAIPEGFGTFEFPDLGLGDLFKEEPIDKNGCECEACKNGTGQCSDKRAECDAWDVGCELGGGFTDIITDPVSSWWDKFGIWVYVILGVIGLGILLWLLRPLFGVAKNVTGITKSAVTRVNGMK